VVGGADSRSGVETATNGEGDDDDAVHNVPTGGTVAGSSSVASAGVGGGGVPIWPLRGLYDAQELR
jgi:hypothetical protein